MAEIVCSSPSKNGGMVHTHSSKKSKNDLPCFASVASRAEDEFRRGGAVKSPQIVCALILVHQNIWAVGKRLLEPDKMPE